MKSKFKAHKIAPVYQGIKGKTLIDHRKRVKLGLSLSLYCMMDTLNGMCDKKDQVKIIWNFHQFLGIDEDTAKALIEKLIVEGFLEKIDDRNVKILKVWRDEFPPTEDQFETLWNIFRKGTKKIAMDRYYTVIKTVEPEHLIKRRTAYVNHCKSSGTQYKYIMGLDTFLHPESERWDNPLPEDNTNSEQDEYNPEFTS